MAFHLVKTEPSTYSFEKMMKEKICRWDGVRSFPGRKNIRAMNPGDDVLVYHSGTDKYVVGMASVVSESYPDPTAKGEDWSAIDLQAKQALPIKVSLDSIKREKKLSNIYLVRQGRLSVMPLTKIEFETLIKMGGIKK